MESNNGKLWAVGGLVAVALALAGIFVYTSNNDESTTESTQKSTSDSATNQEDTTMQSTSTIVELAQSNEDLSTLVAAVVEAELVDTLNSEGPFTVFAPTNEAFNNLLAELNITAEELLAREDLGDILTYHVVAAEVLAADLSDGQVVTTVQGGELTVNISDSGVTLTDANGNVANVIATDVDASNGVVHLIDAVVLP
ncbi:fasciclin domain-containing protein [Candidatus Saccharibacteria bacterium]|nr:fasciclin domain-containing protein [Candidatus Saccharibacteria bacterium]